MPALPDVSAPKHFGHARNVAGATFGPRLLRDYELVWMTEGSATYWFDGQSVEVPEGAVVLCRAGWRDAFDWDTRRASRHVFVHFDVLRTARSAMAAWPVVVEPRPGDLLRTCLQHLLAWRERGDDALRREVLRTALGCFVRSETDTAVPPRDDLPDAVARVLAFVGERMRRDPSTAISLAEMADVGCVTPEHLCRLFTRSLGHGPSTVVRLWRLDRAVDLLVRSNSSIRQVAASVGFASPFHFSRRFGEAYGMSPTAVRRSVRGGGQPPLPRLNDVVRVQMINQ
ncbi:MAG: helix-turn-helix transcriptional regulator [Planctomycetota bacterium]